MPYRDEAGAEHVWASDPMTVWSQLHIQSCERCRANLFTKLIRNENTVPRYMDEGPSDENTVEDRRYVEDDLNQLSELDDQIRLLVNKRESVVNRIKKGNAANAERVMISDDWFEGELKGQPVPSRGIASNGR